MTQTWFITGASAGFGRAFAEHALEQGYNVAVAARRQEKLAEIEAIDPQRVLALTADVMKPDQVRSGVEKALERFGSVDVLINNAGYGVVGAVEETPEDELRALMETNFFGAMTVTNALLPAMREQKSGAIVMISSMGGQMSFAGFGPYSASKFAMEGLTEALAQEVAPFGIKTMIVEPGAFRTDFAGGGALRHMPANPAYAETVGGTREFASGMHGTQAGDPRKAAKAIDQALRAENTPLRLALGEDSVDAIRGHSQQVLKDLEDWETVARDVNVD